LENGLEGKCSRRAFASCASSLGSDSALGAALGHPPLLAGAVASGPGSGRPGWAGCFLPTLPGSAAPSSSSTSQCIVPLRCKLPLRAAPGQQAASALRPAPAEGFYRLLFSFFFFLLLLLDHIFTQPSHPKVHPSCVFPLVFSRHPVQGSRRGLAEDGGRGFPAPGPRARRHRSALPRGCAVSSALCNLPELR